MDTIRIDLPGGAWADLYDEMKHRTQRAVEELTREHLQYPEGAKKLKISQEGSKEGAVSAEVAAAIKSLDVTVDLEAINWTKVNETIILNQVAAWSFGEVNAAVLGEQSEAVFEALKQKVNTMYAATYPLADSGGLNSAKGWRWLSRFLRVFGYRRN